MVFVYIILLTAGVTPLVAFLVKRSRYRTILRDGIKTTAQATHVRKARMHGRAAYDVITYAYLPEGASAWQSGQHTFGIGRVNVGDTLDVYYLKDDVARHALTGSKGEGWFILGCVLFLAMVVYGCLQIHETMRGKTIDFSP